MLNPLLLILVPSVFFIASIASDGLEYLAAHTPFFDRPEQSDNHAQPSIISSLASTITVPPHFLQVASLLESVITLNLPILCPLVSGIDLPALINSTSSSL